MVLILGSASSPSAELAYKIYAKCGDSSEREKMIKEASEIKQAIASGEIKLAEQRLKKLDAPPVNGVR